MTWNARAARAIIVAALVDTVPSMESEAQERLRIRPFVSVAEMHESDVFSTPADRRSDVITRVTPGVDATYESPVLTLSGTYTADLERFERYSGLTSMDARQQGTASLTFRPTPRASVTASGEALTTRTPRDLNLATGLTASRARARRYGANTSVTRQLDPVSSGTIAYTFTADRLGSSFAADTHAADATYERRLSPRTDVRGRYRVQSFRFTGADARSAVTSHAAGIGARRAITPRLHASIDIGPRLTGDVVRPELAASVTCRCARMDLAVAYTRTQATVIGLAGAADVESVGMTIGRTLGRSLDVQVVPGFFRSRLASQSADVYALGIDLTRTIFPGVALEVSLQGALQRGNVYPGAPDDVLPRHGVAVRLVAGRPAAARTPR